MQNKKEKIALFDFCGTMVPFQSAEAYVNYVVVHTNSCSTKCRHFLYLILRKLHIISRLERLSKGVITNKKIMIGRSEQTHLGVYCFLNVIQRR